MIWAKFTGLLCGAVLQAGATALCLHQPGTQTTTAWSIYARFLISRTERIMLTWRELVLPLFVSFRSVFACNWNSVRSNWLHWVSYSLPCTSGTLCYMIKLFRVLFYPCDDITILENMIDKKFYLWKCWISVNIALNFLSYTWVCEWNILEDNVLKWSIFTTCNHRWQHIC